MRRARFWLVVLGSGVFLGVTISNEECLVCHENVKQVEAPHEKIPCQKCHTDIEEIPHPVPVKKIECLRCHSGMMGLWEGDPHEMARKKGNPRAPECTSCHGKHDLKTWKRETGITPGEHRQNVTAFCSTCHPSIQAPQQYHLWPKTSNEECLRCHSNPEVQAPQIDRHALQISVHREHLCTYCHRDVVKTPHIPAPKEVDCGICHLPESALNQESIHGEAVRMGIRAAAHCWDCHGAHNVFRKDEPSSSVYPTNLPDTCGKCHARPELAQKFGIPVRNPVALYKLSIHYQKVREGKPAANCNHCHGAHDILPLENPKSRIFKGSVPKTCGECHQTVYALYTRSIHWTGYLKGVKDAPVCNDCHTEHSIFSPQNPSSPVFSARIPETCTRCHESAIITTRYGIPTMSKESYFASYHGLALKAGKVTAANCASCHQAHYILPSSDPQSSVHPKNLPHTCGQCHPGIRQAGARVRIHTAGAERERSKTVEMLFRLVRGFYIALIISVIGGMLVHNFLHFRMVVRHRNRSR
ncbi:MAG: cytochrome c3 family protein [bacterium JZ-2024 1]